MHRIVLEVFVDDEEEYRVESEVEAFAETLGASYNLHNYTEEDED